MEQLIAERMLGVPRSFIREILKVSLDPQIISFAGGLPNAAYFPVQAIQQAAETVFSRYGAGVLQYGKSEGDEHLRQLISERYREKKGITLPPESIIITNGSQQGIDLLGKVLLDQGDNLLIEEPGYLGAIQSLSLFRVNFVPVVLNDDGLDTSALEAAVKKSRAKMLYTVPAFQNPSGITYSDENKKDVAAIAREYRFVVVEDDPYSELRFAGSPVHSFFDYLPEQTVLLGSFSKIIAPGFRLGWIAAPPWLHEKLIIAKQAADLHTSRFTQRILAEYLACNNLDEHIEKIKRAYGNQCHAMQDALGRHFPASIRFTRPEGGMFLWGRLPGGMDSMKLFQAAVQEKVVFVPGNPFYTGSGTASTLRFSFSCVDPETIEEGVRRMARALTGFDSYL